jgi:hypothetical protein
MPDWCLTEVIFEGENTEKLYSDWENALRESSEKEGYVWFGILFNYKNIKDIETYRMFVDDVEFDKNAKTVYFRIEEPYEPNFEAYNTIAELYNLNYYVLAEEPAGRVFINTDTSGKYFPEKYYFEFFAEDIPVKNELLTTLQRLHEIRYIEDFQTIREILKNYKIETEEDMAKLCTYIEETYPDVIIVFGKFINPFQKS